MALPFIPAVILGVMLTAQPLADEDVLEPSVQNEVEHALALAPTNAPAFAPVPVVTVTTNWVTDVFSTNGLAATEIAIRLISSQKSDGRWYFGTNDVTSAARAILETLR